MYLPVGRGLTAGLDKERLPQPTVSTTNAHRMAPALLCRALGSRAACDVAQTDACHNRK